MTRDFRSGAYPSSILCEWDEADRRLGDEPRMMAVREASADAQVSAENEAAVFVIGHCGLGRRVTLGRSQAELGVMRINKAAAVGHELGLDLDDRGRPCSSSCGRARRRAGSIQPRVVCRGSRLPWLDAC